MFIKLPKIVVVSDFSPSLLKLKKGILSPLTRKVFLIEDCLSYHCTKMKFFIKDFFSKCESSYLLKKSLMENFIFCAVYQANVFVRTKLFKKWLFAKYPISVAEAINPDYRSFFKGQCLLMMLPHHKFKHSFGKSSKSNTDSVSIPFHNLGTLLPFLRLIYSTFYWHYVSGNFMLGII